MNDKILIQQAYSNSEYANMFKLTFNRHVQYCLNHKYDFSLHISDVENHYQGEGCWSKVWLVHNALLQGYKFVAWIDADAYIHDLTNDLQEALPDGGIGCTWHTSPCEHWNTGVMYFRNSPRTLQFFDEWLSQAPGNDSWHEQSIYNRMAHDEQWQDVVRTVDAKYNCTINNNETPNYIVRAFHGAGDINNRMCLMAEALK